MIIYEYRVTAFVGARLGVGLAGYWLTQVDEPYVWFFLSLPVLPSGVAAGICQISPGPD